MSCEYKPRKYFIQSCNIIVCFEILIFKLYFCEKLSAFKIRVFFALFSVVLKKYFFNFFVEIC